MKIIDRTGWNAGPWDGEPDRVEWVSGGVYCQCNRNSLGSWCGYVGVPSDHRWYGKGYDDIHTAEPELEVHGGLTFASEFKDGEQAPAGLWIVGFDCSHAWDIAPGVDARLNAVGSSFSGMMPPHMAQESYKTLTFAMAEVLRLADYAGTGEPFSVPILVRVEDAERVRVGGYPGAVVGGDGAVLFRDVVRGTGHIGVAIDWLEEHPEFTDVTREDAAAIVTRLRERYPQ